MEREPQPAPVEAVGVPASPAGSVVPQPVAVVPSPPDVLPPAGTVVPPVPGDSGPVVRVPEAKDAGGFDPERSSEVVNERGEFSKVYRNPDGTTAAVISQLPVHYRTAFGGWADIVAQFVADPRSGSAVAVKNSFTVRADRTGVSIVTAKGRALHLSVRTDDALLPLPSVTDDGSSVTYSEVWPGVDVRFRLDAVSVRKELVLKRADVPGSYDVLLDGVRVSEDDKGRLVVDKTDEADVRVGQVEVFDREGTPVDAAKHIAEKATPRGDDGSALTLTVDPAWLESLRPEDFPVVIDPPVTIGNMSGWSAAWARDTGNNEFACSVPSGYCSSARVGNASTTGLYRWRSVFAFDYSAYLPSTATAPFNRTLTSASINLTYQAGPTAAATVYVRRASEWGWCGVFLSAAPPCSVPNYAYQAAAIGTGSASFNVTAYMDPYWAAGAPLVGFAMNGDETPGVNNYKALTASMTLIYNTVPTVTNAAPADNAIINAGTASVPSVTLSASGSDADAGDTLQYRFEVQKLVGGQWVADATNSTSYSSSASATLPMTNGWDSTFAWRAWARDSTGAEASTVFRYFVTTRGPTAPQGPLASTIASPTLPAFWLMSPNNVAVSWRFRLCEIAPGSVCGAMTAALAADSTSGGVSYKQPNFAQLGWQMELGKRYVVQGFAPNDTGIWDARSQVEISYVSPVAVSTASEVLPGQVNSLQPTFTAPTSSGSVTYTGFYFCANPGTAVPAVASTPEASTCATARSTWLSTPTFQLPAGLAWGQVYNVYVWARTTPGATPVAGILKFFVTRVAVENRLRSVSLDPSTGVDAATGNFSISRTDVTVAGPSGLLSIARTYNSASTASGALGRGWSSMLDQRAQWDATGPGVWLTMADGSREFHGQQTGGGFAKPIGSVVDVKTSGVPAGVWMQVTDANETLFDYDVNGNLIRITDREGHALTLSVRNPTTFVQTLTDVASGRTLTLVWSGAGVSDRVVTATTQAVGGQALTWRYGYSADLLTQVCDPRDNTLNTGKCEKYGYTSNRMTTLTEIGRALPSVTIGYTNGRVSTRTDADNKQFTYSAPTTVQVAPPNGATQPFTQVVITDPRLFTTTEQYDDSNRLVHRIDRAGGHRWLQYNAEGLLYKVTDETGATETYGYDSDANMTSKTNALGNQWTYTYDSTHRKLTETTPLGNVTTYSYDTTSANVWTEEIAPSTADQSSTPSRTTRTERTAGTEAAYGGTGTMPKGLLRRTIDPAGRVTVFDYDAKGDLRRVTDPAGKTTVYTYDELGRESSRTVTWLDGDGVPITATWTTTWTVLSQKATETEPAVTNQAASPAVTHQRRTAWTYDDRGNVTKVRDTDLLGGDAARETNYEYDLVDREWRVTAADGGVTTREFDANGNVTKVTDPLGRIYTTSYDPRNLPLAVTLTNYINPVPGGTGVSKPVRSTTYTVRGQVDTETDALGRQVKHRYDQAGRRYQTELVTYTRADGSTVSPFVTHFVQFDADGRAWREETGNGMARVDRTFDQQGRISTERLYNTVPNTGSQDRLITYRYDPNDNITSRIVTCHLSCSLAAIEERTVFDPHGRPVQQIVENGASDLVTVTRYDQAGNPVAFTDPRGTANPSSPLAAFTTVTRYDLLGRVTSTIAPSVIVDVKDTSTTTANATTLAGYNAFGEPTHVVDPNGNRTITGYDTSGRRVTITHPSYTPPGGIAITATEAFSYDLAGNLTSRVDRLGQTWVFTFDSFNQAVRETAPRATPTASNPVTVSSYDDVGNLQSVVDPTGALVTYTYDQLNRRRTMAQTVRPYGSVTTTNVFTTTFDHDGLGNLIYTQEPNGAVTTQVYSPAGELLQQTLPGSGAGISRTIYTYDLAGRVLTTTDPMNRVVRNTYDTAGRIAATSQFASPTQPTALATTSYTVDAAGNTTRITRPEGDSTDFTFDALNQIRTVTSANGVPERAFWRLGDLGGTTAFDSSGNASSGSLQGTYTLNQTGAVTGSTDTAITFAGGNVDIPAAAVTGTTKTYAIWFRTSSNGVLISKSNAATGSTPSNFTPLMYVGTDGRLYAGTSTTQMIVTTSSVNNNTWRRAALTITPDTQRLYLDGTLVGSVTTAAPVADSWATKAYLATGYTAGYPATNGAWMPFTGTLDEAVIYNQPIGESLVGTQAWAQPSAPPPPASTIVATKTYDTTTDGMGVWWNATVTRVTTPTRTGAGALAVTGNGNYFGTADNTTPAITITPTNSYRISTWTRAATTAATITLYANWQDTNGTLISTTQAVPSVSNTTSGWTNLTATIHPPTNAARLQITYKIEATTANQTHYFDDTTITAIPVTTSVVATKTFESGLDGMTNTSQVTATSSTAEAHTGSRSLQLVPTSSGWSVTDATVIPVDPTKTYQVSGHGKTTGWWMTIAVQWLDNTNTVITTTDIGIADSNGTWQPFSSVNATPPANATGLRVRLYAWNNFTRYFDNIIITAITPTTTTTPTNTIVHTYGYDAAGNPTKLVDPAGNTWWTTYNTWNLEQSRVEPSATASPVEPEADRTFTTTYTATGQVASQRSPGGIRVDNTYDNLGQLITQTGVGAPGTRTFTYDLAGRPRTSTNGSGTITLGYDDRGLLATSTGLGGNSTFTYDSIGRLVTRVDGAGTTSFGWTPRNELYSVTEPSTGRTLVRSYNDARQLTGINFDGGAAGAATRTIGYDTTGRIASDITRNTANAVTLSTTYTYDRNDNLTTKTVSGTGVAGAGTNRYFYDRSNRLINWFRPDRIPNEYTYDANGNRTRNATVTSTYDQRNRIINNGTTSHVWTTRGTLASTTTAGVTTTYTHNAFGEMTAAGATTYTYDPLGRTSTRTNGTTANFTYTGTNADPTGDGTYTYTRTPSGTPVAVKQGTTNQLLNLNSHGDVTATLATAGATAQTIDYDPYGVVRATAGGTRPSIGYQADWTDPTSGLVNMGARWYQPATGGFTSRDTYNGRLDTPITLNRYTYANNNPMRYFDPTGYASADTMEKQLSKPKPTPKPATRPTFTQSADTLERKAIALVAQKSSAKGLTADSAERQQMAAAASVAADLRAWAINQTTPSPKPLAPLDSVPPSGTPPAGSPIDDPQHPVWSEFPAEANLLGALCQTPGGGAQCAQFRILGDTLDLDYLRQVSRLMPPVDLMTTLSSNQLVSTNYQAQQIAGLAAGRVLTAAQAQGQDPDYIVIDAEYLAPVFANPLLSVGAGSLLVYSKSGAVFAGPQINGGTPGFSVSARLGFLNDGPGSATGDAVDSYLEGAAGSIAGGCGVTFASGVSFASLDTSYEYGLGVSGCPTVSVSVSYLDLVGSRQTKGWSAK